MMIMAGQRIILYIIIIAVFPIVPLYSEEGESMALPKPDLNGVFSVEQAIQKRRSVRSYSSKEISLEHISQLLWACQGVTDSAGGFRSSPSAGALYPLEIYVVKKDGVFHYIPDGHRLEKRSGADIRSEIASAAYGQEFIREAPIGIVITAVYERITSKYGERGIRYTNMEAGHAAQNVFLQAVALGLDSVAVGAFDDASVVRALKLQRNEKPLYILPVGYGEKN